RPRRLRRARLRRRAGAAAELVRTRRARVGRDPGTRDRTRPGHAGAPAQARRRLGVTRKGGSMKARVGGLLVAALVVAAALAGGSAAAKASCGTVTLNEQAWAGSTANTYVVKNVLEQSLKCKVNITKVAEVPVYQAMADGKTDAILEDGGHVPQWAQYVTKQKTVVRAGANGVKGVIGWYVPTYLMKQHPELKTWKGLKGKESLFKSPESGSQGMFLGGDPSYQQKDKTLIKALGLNLKFVSVGAEPAQVAR